MSTANVYYEPEHFGLEMVDSLDEAHLSYEYNTLIVLKHKDSGRVFSAQDSGCSCPTPFEGYAFHGPDDTNLSEVTLHNFAGFESEVAQFPALQHERDAMLDKVRAALKVRAEAEGRQAEP